MFFVPFPSPAKRTTNRTKRGKGSAQAGRKQASAATAAAAAKPPRPRPAWDSTSSDLSQHRLSAAEMAFRQSLRRGSHRLRPCSQGGGSLGGAPGGGGREEEEGALPHPPGPGLEPEAQPNCCSGEDSDSDGSTSSLAGMRAFVRELQHKYRLSGDPLQAEPSGRSTHESEGGGQQSLTQLLEEALQLQAAELGAASDDDEGSPKAAESAGCAAAPAAHRPNHSAAPAAAAAEHGGSDSEGEGHLGPAALRRVQRRLATATTTVPTGAAGRLGGAPSCTHPPMAPAPQQLQQQSLLERLAAAEAQLERHSALEAELHRTRAAVAELQAANAQLRTGGACGCTSPVTFPMPAVHICAHTRLRPPLQTWTRACST